VERGEDPGAAGFGVRGGRGDAGRPVRRLPHHDETGAADAAHLRAARARLPQVQWLDPASEERARRHLDAH
jgi:hypothetical protein